jgi:hypothetical protein
LVHHDVFVVKLSQEGYLADGCGGEAFVFHIEDDLLHGDNFLASAIEAAVDVPIGSLA